MIPVAGLARLRDVAWIMSEARATTRFVGDGRATVWLTTNGKAFDRTKMERALADKAIAEAELVDR